MNVLYITAGGGYIMETINERMDHIFKQYISDLIEHAEESYFKGDEELSRFLLDKVESFAQHIDNKGEIFWAMPLNGQGGKLGGGY
jgi:hypothetical protein